MCNVMESSRMLTMWPAGNNDSISFQTVRSYLWFFSSFNQDLSFCPHLTHFFLFSIKCTGRVVVFVRGPLRPWKRHPLTAAPAIPSWPRPCLLFSAPRRLFLSRPRYSTLEFADVGIMRPQPVNNETKDVAHQLRSIDCLASISSAPQPPSICVRIQFTAVCEVSDAISPLLLSSLSSLGCFRPAHGQKNTH